MLKRETRIAILELRKRGKGIRAIAEAVGVSRVTVRDVLASGEAERPEMERTSRLDDELERVRELFLRCEGNLVRVHEELGAAGVQVGYTTLTAFCRREKIGVVEKVPAGNYHFAPGSEMQHDTSPHDVTIGERKRRLCLRGALPLTDDLRAAVPQLRPVLRQDLPDRRDVFLRRRHIRVHGRQHQRRRCARYGEERGDRSRNGGVRQTLRLPVRGPREGRRQPLGTCRAAL